MSINQIDINQGYTDKLNIVNTLTELDNIETFENNFYLKNSLINIDSTYRNKTPQNIVDMNPIILPSNPLQTTANSSLIELLSLNDIKVVETFLR